MGENDAFSSMVSETEDSKSQVGPGTEQQETTNTRMILKTVLLLLLIGGISIILFFSFNGADYTHTTYTTDSQGGSDGSSNGLPGPTTTTTTNVVQTDTKLAATTTPKTTESTTPNMTQSTTPSMSESTSQITSESTTQVTSESTTPITTESTTPSTASTMATTADTRPPNWRPMNPKTILCTFGRTANESTVGPQDGICDVIFFEFFYVSMRGSFLKRNDTALLWFLSYVRNNTGTTEFGLGLDHSHADDVTIDLRTKGGEDAFRYFWSQKIRHYGLLKFPVHDALVTLRDTGLHYISLFKKLRELQEVNRAGKFNETGYLIFGIGLYPPWTGPVHGYLREILQLSPIDAVIIRTHLEDPPQDRGGCKITGPNVYANSSNKYEVSMEGALDYVQRHYDLFRGRSLMVSFSMSMFFVKPKDTVSRVGYLIGSDCEFIQFLDTGAMCALSNLKYLMGLVPLQHVMHGSDMKDKGVITYDSSETIKWKICMSTKRYSTLEFGVALFNLEHEDGTMKCSQHGNGHFTDLAGYRRSQDVSHYMKNVIRKPDFLKLNPTC